jgi:OmpA-OmpF porin, OOP family
MSFLGRRVRDEGMTMGGLSNLLHREAPSIRAALPASLGDLFWPREHTATTTRPVVAQTVTREASSSAGWLLPLFLLALIPGLIWLFHHARTVTPSTITVPVPRTGTANRTIPDEVTTPKMPEVPKAPAMSNVDLYFNTGSSKLRPESEAKLREFAATLRSHPGAHLNLGGYTDNVGDESQNLKLSQRRADAVMAELTHKGIAADRLTAKGYGEDDPIADNGTAPGRAKNRRVSVGLTD